MFINNLIDKMPLVIQKNMDKILIGTGIISGVGATIFAIKQTPKATKILEQYNKTKKDIDEVAELKDKDSSVPYTEEDEKKDRQANRLNTLGQLCKVYAPVFGLTTLSITCTLCGYGIVNNRYLLANALFLSNRKAFEAYRENVKHKYGEEVDEQMRSGDFEYTEVKKEVVDGEEKEVVETKKGKKVHEQFIRVFNATTAGTIFSKDPEENKNFLLLWQSHFNDILDSKGYVLLNDIFEVLNFKKTKQGQIYGWLKKKDEDVKIDFGIFNRQNIQFINGDDPEVVLFFNVMHNVLHSDYFENVCTEEESEWADEYYAYINK